MTINAPGHIIRSEMRRCGYTLESLSAACDISKAVLHGILTDRAVTISTRNLCAMARVFGYGTAEFIDLLHGITPACSS